jgi:hypothetical protein
VDQFASFKTDKQIQQPAEIKYGASAQSTAPPQIDNTVIENVDLG